MSEYCATCQISQLAIPEGETVRFLLLKKHVYALDHFKSQRFNAKGEDITAIFGYQPNSNAGREGCYPDTLWEPLYAPVLAKYNAFGSVIEIDETSLSWHFLNKTIDENIVDVVQGENPYYEASAKKKMSTEELLNVLRDGRLIFKDDWKKEYKVPVCQTMIREDVFLEVIKLNSKSYDAEMLFQEAMRVFKSENMIYAKYDHTSLFSQLFYGSSRANLKNYKDWLITQVFEKKISIGSIQFQNAIKDLINFISVCSYMNVLRKGWHPGIGLGGSRSNFWCNAKYFESMARIARTAIVKR